MGVKTVLTEFVAYIDLSQIPVDEMTDRTRRIVANAICGFANFGSVGILIGGLTIIAPEKREVFLSLAWKTLIGRHFGDLPVWLRLSALLPASLLAVEPKLRGIQRLRDNTSARSLRPAGESVLETWRRSAYSLRAGRTRGE